MTIDKAIKMQEEIIDEGWLISDLEKCPAIDSCELAINIMHKYQKIAEIVTNNELEWGNASVRANAFLEVKKVVEDGKDII